MSVGLTCGHLTRGVCARCRALTQEFALQRERERGVAEGVAAERARVVAWLVKSADRTSDDKTGPVKIVLLNSAVAIERGEHEEGA